MKTEDFVPKKAPDFTLQNADGVSVSLDDFAGKKVILFFYPKNFTPGCTNENCDFNASYAEFIKRGYALVGISPDKVESHAKFKDAHSLKQVLLSDPDKEVAKAYGAWGIKKNYGKEYEGLIRSTFVIDENKNIIKEYKNIRAKGHVERLLKELC